MSTLTTKLRKKSRQGTVNALANILVSEGSDAAGRIINQIQPPFPLIHREDTVAVVKQSHALKQGLRFLHKSDQTDYEATDYVIPRHWNPSYSISKLTVRSKAPCYFSSHNSETYLIPISGMLNVRFAVFATQDGKGIININDTAGKEIKSGEIVRLQSSIPHQIFSVGEKESIALLITKHCGGSPVACVGIGGLPNGYARTLEEIQQHPEYYPLLASGLAELIFITRRFMQLDVQDVAKEINISKPHICRIEKAVTNPHLDLLGRLCDFLKIPLQIITERPWLAHRCEFNQLSSWKTSGSQFSFEIKSLRPAETQEIVGEETLRPDTVTTLIILQGDVIVSASGSSSKDYLVSGDVCHLKIGTRTHLQALNESSVLVVR